jgi:hypothetical protein
MRGRGGEERRGEERRGEERRERGGGGRDGGREQMKMKKIIFNVHTSSDAHPASCSLGTRVLTQEEGSRDTKLTTNLHLVPRLRMSGALPPLPPICFHGIDREKIYIKSSGIHHFTPKLLFG